MRLDLLEAPRFTVVTVGGAMPARDGGAAALASKFGGGEAKAGVEVDRREDDIVGNGLGTLGQRRAGERWHSSECRLVLKQMLVCGHWQATSQNSDDAV